MRTFLKVALTLTLVMFIVFIPVYVFHRGMNEAANDFHEMINKEDPRQQIYDSIPRELIEQNLFPKNMKPVGSACGWAMTFPDRTHITYYYIPEELYDQYKHYWLEGVDKKDLRDNYNETLGRIGEYVFRSISVDDYLLSADREEGNVLLKANVQYYRVDVYDRAIYYEVVKDYSSEQNPDNYYESSRHGEDPDSCSASYMFHQEDGKWIIEQMHFD